MAKSKKPIHKIQFKNFSKQVWNLESMGEDDEDIDSWERKQTVMSEDHVISWALENEERVNFPRQILRYVKRKGWELEVWDKELVEKDLH